MTVLKKPISRVSQSQVFEKGKLRDIVVILEPPGLLYFRAKGMRKKYALPVAACYTLAVRAHVKDEKKRKQKERKKRK